MDEKNFKSGFAVLTGLPNAGKSTLLNALAGGLLSAVTHKPQTTRQNILAICEGENYQIVFVDTPGFLHAEYKLQEIMLNSLNQAITQDADLVIFVYDATQPLAKHAPLIIKLKELKIAKTFRICASKKIGLETLKEEVARALPQSPAYFPAGQWTDRWERFYAAEFIREQIFLTYQKEIPYSTYVEVEKFTEDLGPKNFIRAIIHVERESQKPIIIGKGGSMIGKLRERAQKRIEEFLGKKYRVELQVKVSPNWRNDSAMLEQFGYINKDEGPRSN